MCYRSKAIKSSENKFYFNICPSSNKSFILISQLQYSIIIGGDFNAHFNTWGCESKNVVGSQLNNHINQNVFIILNNGDPTMEDKQKVFPQ